MNWLTELVNQHKEFESPDSFNLWAGLVAISAVVKDNVYLDKYKYKLYPNLYVLLYAESGLKKGPSIALARRLVGKVNNTKIFSGRFSIQGFLKELASAETQPGGIVVGCTALICLSELTASLVEDPFALDILTDLYDRHYRIGTWDSILKQERFDLKDPTVSFIAGTNPAHGSEFFSNKDIQGGFLGRTNIIYPDGEVKINSLMFRPEVEPNYDELASYLIDLSKVRGGFQMSEEVRRNFDNWYKDYRQNLRDINFKDPTGALNRFDDNVLKVAMLYSLAETPDLIIKQRHIDFAIEECKKIIGNSRRALLGKGKDQLAEEKALLIRELLDRPNHQISRKELHQKYWATASVEDWDRVALQMEIAGVIRIDNIGGGVIYAMSPDIVESFRSHFRGN